MNDHTKERIFNGIQEHVIFMILLLTHIPNILIIFLQACIYWVFLTIDAMIKYLIPIFYNTSSKSFEKHINYTL